MQTINQTFRKLSITVTTHLGEIILYIDSMTNQGVVAAMFLSPNTIELIPHRLPKKTIVHKSNAMASAVKLAFYGLLGTENRK